MRFARYARLFSFLLLPIPILGQQTATSSPQGATFLTQAFAAMVGRGSISDVTLTGTVRRIAGSEDESGSVALKALATGESRMDCTLPSGQNSEIRSIASEGAPAGAWNRSDGVSHAMSQHNLLTSPSWFQPAITLGLVLSQNQTVSYIGQETRNGVSVIHVAATQQFTFPGVGTQTIALLQHLSQTDIFLDTTTLLPAALAFNQHPDDDAGVDISIQVRFSDYRAVNGVQIPFHIQSYTNNTLTLDIQIQTAILNSGLTASAFAIQ